MRTTVFGEVDDRGIIYNDKPLGLAAHYGFIPKSCRPYRTKTNVWSLSIVSRLSRRHDDASGRLHQGQHRAAGWEWLGIEAQRVAITRFCQVEGYEVEAEHIEVESGKGSDAISWIQVARSRR
jgi:hypothetical protein